MYSRFSKDTQFSIYIQRMPIMSVNI